MKNRFTSIDVMAAVHDLKALEGMRVNNIYDINSKTYLIRLQRPEEKAVILFESGLRIHRTYHDWPKSQFPSSFSMKMRKHVKQKWFTEVRQLGVDRVVDMKFGDKEMAVHVIVELYDRGNVLLTDSTYTILNILRPRTDKDTDVRLSVKEVYPVDSLRQVDTLPTRSDLENALAAAKKGDNLRRLIAPLVQFGGPLIDHILFGEGFASNAQYSGEVTSDMLDKFERAIAEGSNVYQDIRNNPAKGYVTYKEDRRIDGEKIESYQDYHPYLFAQCAKGLFREFASFSEAVDEFHSKMEGQKQDQRNLNIERDAMKKLENVKKDQETRIQALAECQDKQKLIAERIIMNKELVERALLVIQSAIANQLTWDAIGEMRQKAAQAGDAVAKSIIKLNLDNNQFTMRLADPYDVEEPTVDVAIDISLNAYQNSRKYFDDKKAAAEKVQKTLASAGKAIKNAQQRTKETLEQVRIRSDVAKTRKPMWFEKFVWFISSENYVVVAGRDAQQNEFLVKRYLRAGDIYMHADIRGAASIVIRNKPGKGDIPPKTLTEAAQMAVCYSNAWEAKVVASAWWVRHDQVSRTAPTGEYLTTGSFMIRGKKNFMPASQLVMGFGLLFRVDEESVQRHKGERRVAEATVLDGENVESIPEEQVADGDVIDVESDGDEKEGEKKEGGDAEEKEAEDEFPDVMVNIKDLNTKDEEYHIIEIGRKVPPKKTQKPTKEQETQMYLEQKKEEERKAALANKGPSKRQKHKEAKMKKKYGDQDDEERELRMQALCSRGKPTVAATPAPVTSEPEKPKEPKPERAPRQVKEEEDDDDKEEETGTVEDSEGLLEQLTGKPVDEDGLLYAVPMVAPYSALNNFKYKVKLTPGTGKRGKAAKSAFELFIRSKKPIAREEALIRALITDEQSARNIPGKVRVSAPQLYNNK